MDYEFDTLPLSYLNMLKNAPNVAYINFDNVWTLQENIYLLGGGLNPWPSDHEPYSLPLSYWTKLKNVTNVFHIILYNVWALQQNICLLHWELNPWPSGHEPDTLSTELMEHVGKCTFLKILIAITTEACASFLFLPCEVAPKQFHQSDLYLYSSSLHILYKANIKHMFMLNKPRLEEIKMNRLHYPSASLL